MGFIKQLFYATILPKEVREAVKIEQLEKQNKLLQKQIEQQEEIRMSGTMLDEIRYTRRRDEV